MPKGTIDDITTIARDLDDNASINWTKADKSLEITFELSHHPDASDIIKIILHVDGTWEYQRDTDDGRDPYDREMKAPYEP